MCAIRFNGSVTEVTSFALMSAVSLSGQNSNPFMASRSTLPTGSATVKRPGLWNMLSPARLIIA